MAEAEHLVDSLPDPENAVLPDVLLSRGHLPLQPLHLRERGVLDGSLGSEGEESGHGLGKDGGETVDDAAGVEEDDGSELLAEAGVDAELGVVDFGVEGDLEVVRDVAVGPGTM